MGFYGHDLQEFLAKRQASIKSCRNLFGNADFPFTLPLTPIKSLRQLVSLLPEFSPFFVSFISFAAMVPIRYFENLHRVFFPSPFFWSSVHLSSKARNATCFPCLLAARQYLSFGRLCLPFESGNQALLIIGGFPVKHAFVTSLLCRQTMVSLYVHVDSNH